jgi:hypothetical protein
MFKTACIGCQWVKHVVGFDFRSGLKTSWACFFFFNPFFFKAGSQQENEIC